MNRNVLKLALLFSVAMNVAALGVVAYHSFFRHNGSESHTSAHEEMYQGIALSPEQEREFDRLRADFHAAWHGQYDARMTELRRALLAELVSETPDETRIEELLSAMKEQQAAVQHKLVDHLLSQKALLRPEQRAAFRRVLEVHILPRPEVNPSETHRSEDNPGSH